MANIQLLGINASDSRTIKAKFSTKLNPQIGISNVIVNGVNSIPDALVRSVTVVGDILIIKTLPLTPFGKYKVTFKSSDIPFSSENGLDFLYQDGRLNVFEILGAENPNNILRDNMVEDLSGQPYIPEKGSIIRDFFNGISKDYLKAIFDIRQSKNDNYLSFMVRDERKNRSYGPFDRLNEEGAYKVLRVGLTPENTKIDGLMSFDSFPSGIISLQAMQVTDERLAAGSGIGTFDNLKLTLRKSPVIKVKKIVILYQTGYNYTYDIDKYGYQIKDSTYDENSSQFILLEDNQIVLNQNVLDDISFQIPENGDVISITYEFKSLGKFIDASSVEAYEVLDAIREPVPAIVNQFSLQHFPIVNSSNTIPTSGGVVFLDPYSETPFRTIHPAFTKEIAFKIDALPKFPGEYSIDYSTGRVFVYGAVTKDGTGNFPPAATYKYRSYFKSDLDYTYRDETQELVASPLREMVGKSVKISYRYEYTLVDGIDYKSLVHYEELNERVENRVLSSNTLIVNNYPITNVFRILNETTGEIYRVNRFLDDKIVFSASVPPSIQTKIYERASFENVTDEQLIVIDEITNSSLLKVYKIQLNNSNIISSTEDAIGSSYNTSAYFSRADLFENEIYYENQFLDEIQNTDRLTSVGLYQINYVDGIVYVAVSNSQDFGIGTVNYKAKKIIPEFPHLISVNNVYNSLTQASISKQLSYNSFGDGFIIPSDIPLSDERFLNNDLTLPYILESGSILVSDDIKTVRHVFDNQNILTSISPIDFGQNASFVANQIIPSPDGVQVTLSYVLSPSLSFDTSIVPGISLASVSSVIRVSDSFELLDGYQSIAGNVVTLSISSGALSGDIVNVTFNVVLNTSCTPIVDYDRGGYYVDYTYVADEIVVSYEYGDNVLDFRESISLEPGAEYYVTYLAGALRDSLLDNFGSLITIPELNTFDTDLDRERYRDALIGSLQSFTKGPTVSAMKEMVKSVTKIYPELVESIFEYWGLGISHLYQNSFILNPKDSDRVIIPGIIDNSFYPHESGDYITFPVSSNLRLNEGTLQFNLVPYWDGIDNDATITFKNLNIDGYSIQESNIFIGSQSYNPSIINGEFSLSRFDNAVGLPPAIYTSTGVFIYYDNDVKRWNILAKENPSDGYTISGTITTSGEFYDVKKIDGVGDFNDVLRSTNKQVQFSFNIESEYDGYSSNDGYIPGYSFDGITFMSDDVHYFFDFAETESTNRFSLYKDGRGYLNFSVWDKGARYADVKNKKNKYSVSADIRDWKSGEKHNIAISWKLNTINNRDEMHLFVDGFEVPNIIRYGGIPLASSSDRFRTVLPEIIAGTVPRPIITGTCITTQGSPIISGSVDFGILGILPGDTVQILETGFSVYTVLSVSGSDLTLNSAMPASLDDARLSVNPYSVIVSSEIDLFANIAVSQLISGVETEIPGTRAVLPGYSISNNALNQNVLTIFGNVDVGAQILIRTLGLNHRRCREFVYLWNDQSVLRTQLPPPINLDEVKIRSVILPYEVLTPSNSTIIGPTFNRSFVPSLVSNITEGRQLEIRVSGGNVNFANPTSVTINGTSNIGSSETLLFNSAGKLITTNKWRTITSIDVVTYPANMANSSAGIEVKEAYSVTSSNGNNSYPVIRFAYQKQFGINLQGTGSDVITDNTGLFTISDVGNLIIIEDPISVAGTYSIIEYIDANNIRIDSPLGVSFSSGRYKVFNVNIGRSGFQNGFFFLETAGTVNTPYELPLGYYEFDFSTYLDVDFKTTSNLNAFIGSNFRGLEQSKAIIDEFRILSKALTDVRVGETLQSGQDSITTSAIKTKALKSNKDTLVLLHFDSYPIVNDANYYKMFENYYLQSSDSVNENFGESVVFDIKGMSFDSNNRLTTGTEGTIEFWVSPMFDTYNDPVPRVYFDATSSVYETITSITARTIKISSRAQDILSVRLSTDTDATGRDYFIGGSLSSDRQTITLGAALPYQKTNVIVTYIPSGASGDRVTILKDSEGFISFNVIANNELYQVRQPVFWPSNTWHRIRATFIFNSVNNLDQIRLFVDGEERNSVRFGDGSVFGNDLVFGATTTGVNNNVLVANIDFLDTINSFNLGQDFTGSFVAKARMDNFRLSNKALNVLSIGGQPFDVNYSNNIDNIFPVIENAYTTMLLNFDDIFTKVIDFSIVRDSYFGIFNFALNIIDSFGIVEDSARVKSMLEAMIYSLKPANAKVDIKYIK